MAIRPEAVQAAVRVVLHDMKNQLGVALGATSLVRDQLAGGPAEDLAMGISSLQRLDRAVTLLQNMTRGRLEGSVDFEFFSFLSEFAARAKAKEIAASEALAEQIQRLVEDAGEVRVRAPKGAVHDLLAKGFFAPPDRALRLLGIGLRQLEDDPFMSDGPYLECRFAAGAENIETEILVEQLALRVRGGDFRRGETEEDVWSLRLPLVPGA